jgi:hypothetical protein
LIAAHELSLRVEDESLHLPGSPSITSPNVVVWWDSEGTPCAYSYIQDEAYWLRFPGLASYRFNTCTRETVAVPEPPPQLARVREVYWRCVMPMALHVHGLEVLHASGVRLQQGVLGLCAVSGTGKSTLAYALTRRGHTPWTDDALALAPTESSVETIPLPFNIYLRPASAQHFGTAPVVPALPVGTADPPREPVPLIAVCVLSRTADAGAPVEIVRLSPLQALSSLLAHAYAFGVPGPERRRVMLQTYFHLAARVPIFDVRFAPGLERLEAVLDGIEHAVYAASPR